MPKIGTRIFNKYDIKNIGIVTHITPKNLLYSQDQYTVEWKDKIRTHLALFIERCTIVDNPNDLLKKLL